MSANFNSAVITFSQCSVECREATQCSADREVRSVKPKYVVITPVRDEEVHLRHTLDCMLGQTVRPTEWIIVNDGSTDGTGSIIDQYAARHPWILGVHRQNRGFRKPGGGVVEAFNDGYQHLQTTDWDFLVKFDGD